MRHVRPEQRRAGRSDRIGSGAGVPRGHETAELVGAASTGMKQNLPAPVRLLYTLLLKRRYERAMDELYDGRPVPPIP